MKKCLSMVLVVIMLLCLIPTTAVFASTVITVDIGDIALPVAGNTPDLSATLGNTDGTHKITLVEWSEYDEGWEWQKDMNADDTFKEGYWYVVYVHLETTSGNTFGNSVIGTINNETAHISGNSVQANGTKVCFYTSYQATKPLTAIDKVDLTVVKPVVGQTPTFAKVDTTQYFSEKYGTVSNCFNGVTWTNQSSGVNITVNNPFKADTKYRVTYYLTAKDGYEFTASTACTINGTAAVIELTDQYHAKVSLGDLVPGYGNKTVIDKVDLTVVKPVVGKTPTFAKVDTTQYFSEKYGTVSNCFNGVTWTNQSSGVNITVNNPFKADTKYRVTYYLTAKDGYVFTASTVCTINGTAAVIELTDQYHVKIFLSDLVPGDGHGHIASDWKSDANNHWKECTVVGCGVVIEGSTAAHTAGDWITDTPATVTTNGTKHKECTTCGYVMETGIIPATAPTPAECDGGESCPSGKFVDINAKAWYHLYVDYAVTNGLFGGTSANTFEPETAMTRAMLVTVLWRYEGQPKGYQNTFADVNEKNGSWYIDAVAWAASNGIVNGVGNNRFDPNGKITREQMAAILFRYAQKKGIDTSKRGELSNYPDANKISAYAKEALSWAVGEGIINGSDGKLLPQGNATRAQVATILMRYIENIVKK